MCTVSADTDVCIFTLRIRRLVVNTEQQHRTIALNRESTMMEFKTYVRYIRKEEDATNLCQEWF